MAHLRAHEVPGFIAALECVSRRPPHRGEHARTATPTLVLHGEDDRAITPRRAQATAEAISGARLVKLPRAGHTSSVEEPDAVSAELARFFASLDRG